MPRCFERPASGAGELVVLYCTLAAGAMLLAASCSAALQHQEKAAPIPVSGACAGLQVEEDICAVQCVCPATNTMSLAAAGAGCGAASAMATTFGPVWTDPAGSTHPQMTGAALCEPSFAAGRACIRC
ncbi:hypothetical protein ABPG77_006408 [Micractinium sp. CCAP 211/92]